jgi:endonuclease G
MPTESNTQRIDLLSDEILGAAEERLKRRQDVRDRARQKIADGDLRGLDSPARLRARIDRLQGHPLAGRTAEIAGAIGRPGALAIQPGEAFLERVIGGENFLGVSFFDLGRRAARSIGRIEIRTPDGRSGHATGSLVAPRLLLTNRHVLPLASWARQSRVVFDHEDDLDGRPRPTVTFELDPDAFYEAHPELDFALVAVRETSLVPAGVRLDSYGFLPLDPTQGKISIGEPINIIQHPGGLPKQVVLQDNRLLDLPDDPPDWLHYEADTEPGSSGAPLFNLEWEVVGLHHAGWPRRDEAGRILARGGGLWSEELGEQAVDWLGNEGARVSRIVEALRGRLPEITGPQRNLLAALLTPPRRGTAVVPSPGADEFTPTDRGAGSPTRRSAMSEPARDPAAARIDAAGEVRLTIPLEVTVRLGAPVLGAAPVVSGIAGVATGPAPPAGLSALLEQLVLKEPFVDRDYTTRTGYDAQFLGDDLDPLPLPTVTDESLVSRLLDDSGIVIPYEHFSVVLHKGRRLALYTASNVDGRTASRRPEEGRDYSRKGLTGLKNFEIEQWPADPRVPAGDYLPDRFYQEDRKAFDKGHVVRRDDVCWGAGYDQIRRANGDTFHATNCSPQVSKYNQSAQGAGNWGDLENFILAQAKTEIYSLFAGPVFQSNDRWFKGVDNQGPTRAKIPRSFWKVVVARQGDALQAFAFVLRQDLGAVRFESALHEALLQEAALGGGEVDELQLLEFLPTPEWERTMVSLADLEDRLGGLLRFPQRLHEADQFDTPDGEALLGAARLERLAPGG